MSYPAIIVEISVEDRNRIKMEFKMTLNSNDYGSEFEYDEEIEQRKRQRYDLAEKETRKTTSGVPSKSILTSEYTKHEHRNYRFHFLAVDAYARHKQLVNNYMLYYPGATKLFQRDTSKDKTDIDVIHENHRFLWTDADEEDKNWAKTLAKKYWDKLFKEYCISDLSCYKENKIALRWRVENEVVSGKGQFSCGNKRCSESVGLKTWEVNFGYVEHGEKKNALVKLRLCPECSYKLNYHHQRREVTKKPLKRKSVAGSSKEHKHKKKHKRKHKKSSRHSSSCDESEDDTNESPGTSQTDCNLWLGPANLPDKKSREDEFEEYFEDMFL